MTKTINLIITNKCLKKLLILNIEFESKNILVYFDLLSNTKLNKQITATLVFSNTGSKRGKVLKFARS